MSTKRIANIAVISGGSPPDVDSDFNTTVRQHVLSHVADVHGHENFAGLTTFQSLAAKGSFKAMCTIHRVPFAQANKISALIPDGEEGEDCTFENIFDPQSKYYKAGEGFRMATSSDQWADVLAGAMALEGRYRAVGQHPCGYIISSEPLREHIPLRVEKDRVITQWKYEECESMGLIKFDFLGLDTVDIVQHTVESIIKNGKTPPNMVDLIHGPMDDKATYEMFSNGNTIGIFQFGSQMVRDFLKKLRPTEFGDLAACTSLLRPGPMGVLSHVRYAACKNKLEEVQPIHSDFTGGPLDDILMETYGVIVYQEQILKIAGEIGGMTLQEGDDLRKAMGKKKTKLMMQMMPKFFAGGMERGYSEEALQILWDKMAYFAKYGFNKAHAVAYAMNSYQCAYLKTHYPVEFMSAALTQFSGKKDKILELLQESRVMGLKIGTVDINLSDVRVAPDYTGQSEFDILYGLGSINGVSPENAAIIVDEREQNGPFTSVQDVINRCSPLGVNKRNIYENLALAGAFDVFKVTRRGVVQSLPAMMGEAKTKSNKGASLFDILGEGEQEQATVDISTIEEYSFVERQQAEASVVGLYLTEHPLSRMGDGISQSGATTIEKLMNSQTTTKATIVCCITELDVNTRGGHKKIRITADDGTGYMMANLDRKLVKGIEVHTARERVEQYYQEGETGVSDEVKAWAVNAEFESLPMIEKNGVYMMDVTFRPAFGEGNYGARIDGIRMLNLANDGSLPVRVRLVTKSGLDKDLKEKLSTYARAVGAKFPGPYPLHVGVLSHDDCVKDTSLVDYYRKLIEDMAIPAEVSTTKVKTKAKRGGKGTAIQDGGSSLFGNAATSENKAEIKGTRVLPSKAGEPTAERLGEDILAERANYYDTGVRVAKTAKVEELLSTKFGSERIDFGIFDKSILDS